LIEYSSQIREEDSSVVHFQSTVSLDQLKNKPFEEMKFEDSKQMKEEVCDSTPTTTNSNVQISGYEFESFCFGLFYFIFENMFDFLFFV
jgi:hypothetical protein